MYDSGFSCIFLLVGFYHFIYILDFEQRKLSWIDMRENEGLSGCYNVSKFIIVA